MQTDDVELLMSIAIATARVLGFGIATGCQEHMRSALEQHALVATTTNDEPPITVSDPQLAKVLAAAHVARYVTAMVADALSSGFPPDGLLHEHNFFGAKAWFCPCWPIC